MTTLYLLRTNIILLLLSGIISTPEPLKQFENLSKKNSPAQHHDHGDHIHFINSISDIQFLQPVPVFQILTGVIDE
jgi:hypothetical protein